MQSVEQRRQCCVWAMEMWMTFTSFKHESLGQSCPWMNLSTHGGPQEGALWSSSWDGRGNAVRPMLAVPVDFLRAADDFCPCWSVECAQNCWQGTIYRLASIPVSLNDMLCLEQGAALVVGSVVLATEAHCLEVSKQQCFCPLDLPHFLVWGCPVHACNMFSSNPDF